MALEAGDKVEQVVVGLNRKYVGEQSRQQFHLAEQPCALCGESVVLQAENLPLIATEHIKIICLLCLLKQQPENVDMVGVMIDGKKMFPGTGGNA